MSGSPVVYVVDDDASFRRAIARLLRAEGFDVEAFGSAREFLAALRPDSEGCVLADLSMPGMDGLELQGLLAAGSNPLPVVFLSAHGDVPAAARALKRGAVDFLTKQAEKRDLLEAIGRALGRGAAERAERGLRAERRGLFESLSPREREIFAHVVQGRLNKQIASRLGIGERTVKLYRSGLTTKLGISSVAELTRWAQEAGLLPELDRVAASPPTTD